MRVGVKCAVTQHLPQKAAQQLARQMGAALPKRRELRTRIACALTVQPLKHEHALVLSSAYTRGRRTPSPNSIVAATETVLRASMRKSSLPIWPRGSPRPRRRCPLGTSVVNACSSRQLAMIF